MKITNQIEAGLLDNKAFFRGDFYDRFQLRTASTPLQLNEAIAKNYLFPTFYGNVTCAIGIFMCSYDKAKAMLPHPKVSPVSMGGGRALVLFSCYFYKNVLGVAPYNEIAMTLPIQVDPTFNTPVLPMLAPKLFPGFGYHCFSMPVTSLENQIRGEKIWGLPKVVQQIDIEKQGDYCVIDAFESTGENYFHLKVPTSGSDAHFDQSAFLYTTLNNQYLQSQTSFKGDFKINKFMDRLFKKGGQPKTEHIRLGNTKSGKVLQDLEIDPNPFQFRYTESMSSCFDLPNQDYKSPIQF